MDWKYLSDRWSNSVIGLVIGNAIYDSLRCYGSPKFTTITGTGFIIDLDNGIVVTNSHVVIDAITITGKINIIEIDKIRLSLLSICHSKDLALCKIDDDDIKLIKKYRDADVLNMIIGDSLNLSLMEEVMLIGYMDDTLQTTKGVISGFNYCNKKSEDAVSRNPIYIRTTAALNPGNSGGPILNKTGEVVAIATGGIPEQDNVGFLIGIRVFISIYEQMLSSKVLDIPTFGLAWNATSNDLLKYYGTNSHGIYVRGIYKDSCLNGIKKGDIIATITYVSYNEEIKGNINNDGSVILISNNPNILAKRKFCLSEFIDNIPIGATLEINFYRNDNNYTLKIPYVYIDMNRINRLYPQFESFDHIILAGMCFTNLYTNQINELNKRENGENLSYLIENARSRYKKYVIISEIFPGTCVANLGIFTEGNIIKNINGNIIQTVDDIRLVIETNPPNFVIESDDGTFFVIDKDKELQERIMIGKF